MPRYFRFFEDPSLNGLYSHERGDLVNRKPLALVFKQPKKRTGARSASVRKGNQFIKKLKALGL